MTLVPAPHRIAFTAVFFLLAVSCSASTVVSNGSFESPLFSESGFAMPTGWTLDAGVAVISLGAGGLTAVDGQQQVLLGNSGMFQEISQNIGMLSANTSYELSFFVGWRNDDPNSPAVSRSGTVVLTQGTNTLLSVTRMFNPGAGDTLGMYYEATGAFSTGAIVDTTTPVILKIENSSGVAGIQGWFDDVQVTAVPEPRAGGLMALGFLGMGIVDRRRKRAK